jgi:hypothetical protein
MGKQPCSHTRYFLLERRSNERLELRLSPQQAQRIRFGQEVRVRGKQDGKLLAVDPDADAVAVLTEQTSLVAPDLTARRVITLIVDITDGGANRYTVSDRCDERSEQLLANIPLTIAWTYTEIPMDSAVCKNVRGADQLYSSRDVPKPQINADFPFSGIR